MTKRYKVNQGSELLNDQIDATVIDTNACIEDCIVCECPEYSDAIYVCAALNYVHDNGVKINKTNSFLTGEFVCVE